MNGIVADSPLHWLMQPKLKNPILILGFHGWSNAANISTDTLTFFQDLLRPETIAVLDEETFIHYTLDRPTAHIEHGLIHDFEPAVSELSCWVNGDGDHDLVFLMGKEPNLNWNSYSKLILGIIEELGIIRFFTVGGVQDTVSHSSPPMISIVGSTAEMVEETTKLAPGIRPSKYYGPVSIHSRLIKMATDASIPAAGIWGHVPAYLQKSPKLVARIVTLINRTSGAGCSLESLHKKSRELDRKIGEAIARDPDLKHFVENIEGKKVPRRISTKQKVIRLNDFVRRDAKRDLDT
jgi:proteasome assembly chaperone (PAC2) family protein